MSFKSLLCRSSLALVVCACLVAMSYFFVDKPVAFFVHNYRLNEFSFLKWMTFPADIAQALAPIVIVLVVVTLSWGSYTRFQRTMLAMPVNLVITEAIKESLKVAFGRYWPDTWINNNPSLIQDNAYGFHPFHTGIIFGSFPSGHTARIAAVMVVLWIAYPKWRWLSVIVSAAVMLGLLGMNYHFVGDVIAGAFLGVITGGYTAHFFGLDSQEGQTKTSNPASS